MVEAGLKTWPRFLELANSTGPLALNLTDDPLLPNSKSGHNTIMSFAYVAAVSANNRAALKVLDWGGNLGHYAVLIRSLLPDVEISYTCKDVSRTCKAGTSLLPWVRFVDSADDCLLQSFDLVLASSSLQYEQDWRHLVHGLAGATAGTLYITRVPVVEKAPTFAVMQHPYGCYDTEFPGWFFNSAELLSAAQSEGLVLHREFLIDESPNVPGAPEQAEYRGYMFKKS